MDDVDDGGADDDGSGGALKSSQLPDKQLPTPQ